METSMTYELAFTELQSIISMLEDETISVDDLSAKVRRASELIEYCSQKLKVVEGEVNKVINKQKE